MDTQHWIRTAFDEGYSSGDLRLVEPDERTKSEEAKIGGSYRRVIEEAVHPFVVPNSRVLELGPGAGSWTRVLLDCVPDGEVHTVDFVDVSEFLNPEDYDGRLYCHTITEPCYDFLPDNFFDFIFSFGVLCHTVSTVRHDILRQILGKARRRAYAVHQYGSWTKLETWGWERGGVPLEFRNMADDKIWWPRNNGSAMSATARAAGWCVMKTDLNLFGRDGLILLSRPGSL